MQTPVASEVDEKLAFATSVSVTFGLFGLDVCLSLHVEISGPEVGCCFASSGVTIAIRIREEIENKCNQ